MGLAHFIKYFSHLNFYPSFPTSKVDLCVERNWKNYRNLSSKSIYKQWVLPPIFCVSFGFNDSEANLQILEIRKLVHIMCLAFTPPHSPPHSSSTQHCSFRWRWCWEIGEVIVQNAAFWKQPLTSMHLFILQANEIHSITTLVSRENKSFCISQPFANIHHINTLIDLECK